MPIIMPRWRISPTTGSSATPARRSTIASPIAAARGSSSSRSRIARFSEAIAQQTGCPLYVKPCGKPWSPAVIASATSPRMSTAPSGA
jgi:hypothetical protein